jgi:hypothetical protein
MESSGLMSLLQKGRHQTACENKNTPFRPAGRYLPAGERISNSRTLLRQLAAKHAREADQTRAEEHQGARLRCGVNRADGDAAHARRFF